LNEGHDALLALGVFSAYTCRPPSVKRRIGQLHGERRSATAKVGRNIIVDQGWTSVGRQLRMALFESERSNAPS
jgi:hypothetical protein